MIVAAMASTPERLPHLEDMVGTIRPQIDGVGELRVYLNGFKEVPPFLSPAEARLSRDADGDLGDAGRFYWLDREAGADHTHYLAIDDRYKYPGNFVTAMVAECDVRDGKAIVGVDGFTFNSSVSDFDRCFRSSEKLATAQSVHMLGAAAVLLDRRTVDLSRGDFTTHNATDVQLAVAAQRGTPMVALPRPANWITERETTSGPRPSRSQIQLAKAALPDWRLYPDPLVAKFQEISDPINSQALVVETAPEGWFDEQVRALSDRLHGELFFVVVGAMDGVEHDGLRQHIVEHPGWEGLLVEPLPDMMQKLRHNYRGRGNLLFEEAAITERVGTANITRIPAANVGQECPPWADGISSFREDHIVNRYEGLKEYAVQQEVRTITFEALAAKHNLSKIDLLQIDAEGYDKKIFDQIWAANFRPSLIKIEVNYQTIVEVKELQAMLKLYGYQCFFDFDDLIAVKM